MNTTEPSGRNPAPTTRRRAGARSVALAALALVLPAIAPAAPQLLVTIDVESVDGSTLPNQVDAICRDQAPCGLMEIARLLEARNLRGTFFLNVYESRYWGEPALQEIARRLLERGHDVALHTHPQWAYDPQRPYMYQYGAAEQVRIVRDGAEMLRKWTGLPVVAHRAGAYSANLDTIDALHANDIELDGSWFRDYPHSKLGDLQLPDNQPGTAHGVHEIPVTIYERAETPRGMDFMPVDVSIRKLDPNWFRDTDEARAAVDAAIAADPPFIVYFMHSFSLLTPDGTATPASDQAAMANFRVMLERAAAQHLAGTTFRAIHDAGSLPQAPGVGVVPRIAVATPLPNYLAHLPFARPFLVIGCAFGGALLLAFAWRRGRARRAALQAP